MSKNIILTEVEQKFASLCLELSLQISNGHISLDEFESFLKQSRKSQKKKCKQPTFTEAYRELESAMKANSGGNYSIDSSIKNGFNEDKLNQQTFLGVPTSVHIFNQIISNKQIIDEAKRSGDYFECGFVEGITLATELIKNRKLETKGKGIIIYLMNASTGNQCRLCVSRDDDGMLCVGVSEVHPDNIWGDGNGVVCKTL